MFGVHFSEGGEESRHRGESMRCGVPIQELEWVFCLVIEGRGHGPTTSELPTAVWLDTGSRAFACFAMACSVFARLLSRSW